MEAYTENSLNLKYEYDDFFSSSTFSSMDRQFHLSKNKNSVKITLNVSDQEFTCEKEYYLNQKNARFDLESSLELPLSEGLLKVPVSVLLDEINIEESDRIRNENLGFEGLFDQVSNKEKNKLWVDKYFPKTFSDLLSDDRINRNCLAWLKAWDQPVFKKKKVDSRCFLPLSII